MNTICNKKLASNAKTLRKAMTKEELHLWYDFLKSLPVMVHRQKVIGNYIVDFYIAKKKIVTEIDGRQHTAPEHKKTDEISKNAGLPFISFSINSIALFTSFISSFNDPNILFVSLSLTF